jgi:serine protease Do
MPLPRSARRAACLALLLGAFAAAAPAADPVSKWDSTRTTAPDDLSEVKALQTAMKAVVDKCDATTVAVLFGPSAGSGVIVSEDGLVLTAAHVIRDYDTPRAGAMEGRPLPFTAGKAVRIMLPDGKKVDGKTLGINAAEDSGMVQITEKGPNDGKWPFATVAKSGNVAKGQWVVSMGHPSGPKVGRSPVARLGRIEWTDKHTLRSNCTLVGGDSGGPLFDLDGRVIGIHSRIGPGLALNYHVQTDQFKNDWDKLVAGTWVDKPAAVTAAYFGVIFPDDEDEDAWLVKVLEGDPADKAGLQAGDTITRFNDSAVKSVKQFRKLMETAKAGEKVRLGVRRGVNTLTLPVTLGKK